MKNRKYIIIAFVAVIIIAAVIMITQPFKWSEKSFEAVVQETVTQPDGETRLIVERTTEIYGDPMNSLSISEETKLVDANGEEIAIGDFQQGDTVSVTLKEVGDTHFLPGSIEAQGGDREPEKLQLLSSAHQSEYCGVPVGLRLPLW